MRVLPLVESSCPLLNPDKNTRTLDGRKLLVMCNFTGQTQEYSVPDDLISLPREFLVYNYNDSDVENSTRLRPYEAKVYSMNIS